MKHLPAFLLSALLGLPAPLQAQDKTPTPAQNETAVEKSRDLPPIPEELSLPVLASPAFARGSNAFALALHKKLARGKEGDNLAFSPVNLSLALAMCSAGTGGKTKDEIIKILGQDPKRKTHEAAAALIKSLASSADKKTEVSLAQGVWLKPGLNLDPDFQKTATEQYLAASENLDFADTPKALAHLNDWVGQHTNERITDLFDANSVTPNTQLIVASALYFKGMWAVPFKKDSTREESFQLLSGSKKGKGARAASVSVPFMHRQGKMDYAEDEICQTLRLPYASQDWSLIILLPRRADGLAVLEAGLNPATLEKRLFSLQPQPAELSLPRFSARAKLDLKDTLQGLGMKLAFSNEADFSRLCANGGEVKISRVVHQAFVEVSEEGTEAAAATGITFAPKGAVREDPPEVFKADHPFLYLIRHEPSGAIVFMGRMTNPAPAL